MARFPRSVLILSVLVITIWTPHIASAEGSNWAHRGRALPSDTFYWHVSCNGMYEIKDAYLCPATYTYAWGRARFEGATNSGGIPRPFAGSWRVQWLAIVGVDPLKAQDTTDSYTVDVSAVYKDGVRICTNAGLASTARLNPSQAASTTRPCGQEFVSTNAERRLGANLVRFDITLHEKAQCVNSHLGTHTCTPAIDTPYKVRLQCLGDECVQANDPDIYPVLCSWQGICPPS